MKWYKHDANANCDAKLKRVRIKYGMEGYGLYWFCLELIAQNVEKHNLSFELEHDAEVIAHDTGIHYERVQEMMTFMVNLGLFEQRNGIITCWKMLKRLDQSMTSNPEMRDLIKTAKENHDSVMTKPDKVMQDKMRLDENRLDEMRTDERSMTPSASGDDKPPKGLQKTNGNHVAIIQPEGLHEPAWQAYVQNRKELRCKPLTKTGAKQQMAHLAQFTQDVQVAAVAESVRNGWQGVFPEKVKSKATTDFEHNLEMIQGWLDERN